jgi:uncharacterized membrane protein (Fun14 family)
MSFDNISSYASTVGGGFFVGILIGYALKKVIKIVAVLFGLFLAALAYLQSQQIANINWTKLQTVSEGAITTLSNLTMQIPGISSISGDGHAAVAVAVAVATSSLLSMINFGIPLTGSMSAGFTIGFING